jgi:hypothetical protein
MNSLPPTLWPFPAFSFQGAYALDDKMIENWRKMMGLNADFAKSWMDEAQFDWASCFMPQDPEELYARQWTNQMPFFSIPMHYATAMLEQGAAMQRAWLDNWGRMFGMFGMPTLLPAMPVMPDIAAVATSEGDIVDVPAVTVRETPRKGKSV